MAYSAIPTRFFVRDYWSRLNQDGLFPTLSCVGEYLSRFPEAAIREIDSEFWVYRLDQVKEDG